MASSKNIATKALANEEQVVGRTRGRLGRDEEIEGGSAADLIEGERGDDSIEAGNGADTVDGGGTGGGDGTTELPVNPIIPEEDLPDFPGGPEIPEDILEDLQDIIDGQPVDPDFGVEPVPPEVIDEIEDLVEDLPVDPDFGVEPIPPEVIDDLNDFIDQIPVDPDFGVDPDDGQIDNNPIDPDPEDGNGLRVVDVVREPLKSEFEEDVRGSNKPDTVIGNASVDRLTGQDKSDLLRGKKGKDYLYGDNGPDTLIGGKGNDVLQGGNGKDELIGKKGKDILYGGYKRDVLTGNQGRDVFILSPGKDVITDFKLGEDDIGVVYALDLTLKQKGDDLLIKGNDNVRTLLQGVDKNDFLADQGDPSLLPIVEVNVL